MSYRTPKSAFFHIPRTGGTWCHKALKHALGNENVEVIAHHMTANEPAAREKSQGRFTFTFVRNPFAWLRSLYCWEYEHKWRGMLGPAAEFEACRADDFDGFVRKYLAMMPGKVGRVYAAYTDGVDWVGRTEEANASLCRALQLAGEDFNPLRVLSFPAANTTHAKTLGGCEWNDSLAERFVDAEYDLFERWGYLPSNLSLAAHAATGESIGA